MDSHMSLVPPRLMAVHDISGFGRTSLTIVIPLLSSMGIQVCPLPTAVLSTHTTEFTEFTFCDLTDELPKILNHWQKLGLKFNAVYSGFLANHTQVEIVERAFSDFLLEDGLRIVDPVMGDNGILDPTITKDIVLAMQELTKKADIITPNYSEACWLLDEEVKPRSLAELQVLAKRLTHKGTNIAVITSLPTDDKSTVDVLAYVRKEDKYYTASHPYIPAFYPGTGDTFASALTGYMMKKLPLQEALQNAVNFVTNAIQITYDAKTTSKEGILFEKLLEEKKL